MCVKFVDSLSVEEQEKRIANKLHCRHWRNYSYQAEQDAFIYEKLEDGSDNWDGDCHKMWLEKARFVLSLTKDFESAVALLDVIG